ncbi:MAG: FeoC-like transcriptional regulator [bacterium]|nr:FeoC-like transcriptional regulator [bacterium]
MLLHIRNYIWREGVVSTQQLTREFQLDVQALQPMLDLWVHKGAIRKSQEQAACQSTCFKCRDTFEYYQAN